MSDLSHYSEVFNLVHDASGIDKDHLLNYLWFKHNGIYYPDFDTFREDGWPQPSRRELIECIQNLMGAFDTPLARMKYTNDFVEEVRKNGREIMEKLERNNFV